MIKFKGWIPTVSGYLSFSVLGRSDHPAESTSENIASSQKRYIISWQKRVLLDTALPFKEILSRVLLNQEGAFWFVCVGSCSNLSSIDESKELTGVLLLFHGKQMWEKVRQDVADEQNRFSKLSEDEINEYDIEVFKNQLIAESSYFAKYVLQRNGEVELIPTQDMGGLSSDAPKFPAEDSERRHAVHLVCSQLFFFLKDITHRHQHHHPSTDTMVDIYCTDHDDDHSWRSATLRMLLRTILEYKRNPDISFLSSALGVLAYANSFRDISLRSTEKGKLLNYNQQALEQSIRASQDIKSLELQKNSRAHEIFRNSFFSILGVILTASGLIRLTSLERIPATPDPALRATALKTI